MLPQASPTVSRSQYPLNPPKEYTINATPPVIPRAKPYLNITSQDDKVAYLAQETGIELVLAKEFLGTNNWNLEKALVGYKELIEQENKRAKNRPSNNRQQQPKSLARTGRGFSVSNIQLLAECREKLDKERKKSTEESFEVFDASSRQFFVLPNINQFSKELGDFIRNDLISVTTLQTLSAEGRLNWWAEFGACRKLFPLSTVGDGNCLLHAASLGMWGFHDRLLTLRKALYELLLHSAAKGALRRRWKYKLWQDNQKFGGLNYSVEEWEKEWNIIVKLASDRPRQFENGAPSRRISRTFSYKSATDIPQFIEGESLDSLETIHVYAFSNLLCRPIIVIAEEMLKDSQGNPISPIPFGGIYLPLERDPNICFKYPLVLAYNNAHFSALVPAEGEIAHKGERLSTSVPLYDNSLYLLPIHFSIDPGNNWDRVQDDSVKEEKPELTYETKIKLLRQYLDIIRVPMTNKETVKYFDNRSKQKSVERSISRVNDMFVGQPMNEILAAKLNCNELPKHYNEMISNYIESAKRTLEVMNSSKVKCAIPKCQNMIEKSSRSCFCDECSVINYSPKPPHRSSIDQVDSRPTQVNEPQPRRSTVPLIDDHLARNDQVKVPEVRQSHNLISQLNNMNVIAEKPPSYNNAMLNSKTMEKPPLVHLTPTFKSSSLPRQNDGALYNVARHNLPLNNRDSQVSSASSPNIYRKSIEKEEGEFQFRIGQRCVKDGCVFYGSENTKGYCSSCYRKM